MIIKGTTPTVVFTLTDDEEKALDMSNYDKLVITIEDSQKSQLDINKDRFTFNEDYSFEAKLTQEETLALDSGRLKVQLKAKTSDDTVVASCIQYCSLEDILKKEVL